MKHFIVFSLYIIAIVGDAAAYVASAMERAFRLGLSKLREIEDMGGAHERRYLRPVEGEQI